MILLLCILIAKIFSNVERGKEEIFFEQLPQTGYCSRHLRETILSVFFGKLTHIEANVLSCERYFPFASSNVCPTFLHPTLFTKKADFYRYYSFGSFDFCLVSSQWGAPAGDLKDEARGQDTIPLLFLKIASSFNH